MRNWLACLLFLTLLSSCAHVGKRVNLPESEVYPSANYLDKDKRSTPALNFSRDKEDFDGMLEAHRLGVRIIRLNVSTWSSSRHEKDKGSFLIGKDNLYRGLIKEDVERLSKVLQWASLLDLKIILSFTSLPGLRFPGDKQGESHQYENQAATFLHDIALYFGGHDAVFAIDPSNRPLPELLAKSFVASIRRARNHLPIVLNKDNVEIFSPIDDPDIYYGFNWHHNENQIDEALSTLATWRKKHGIESGRIIITDFGANLARDDDKNYLKSLSKAFKDKSYLHILSDFSNNTFLDEKSAVDAIGLSRVEFKKPLCAVLVLDPTEENVKNATAFMTTNLSNRGFDTLILDNGWQKPELAKDNIFTVDETKFPSGIKALRDAADKFGIKLGLTIPIGTLDKSKHYEGAFGFERINARALSDASLDYLILEDGYVDDSEEWDNEVLYASLYEWKKQIAPSTNLIANTNAHQTWFRNFVTMSTTPRRLRSLNDGGPRFATDVVNEFSTIIEAAKVNSRKFLITTKDYNNSPGPLMLGGHLTAAEERSYIAMWAIMGAPFVVPFSKTYSHKTLALLKDEKLARIQLDPLEPGRLLVDDGKMLIFRKKLDDKTVAILVVNVHNKTITPSFSADELNAVNKRVTSLFSGKELKFKRDQLKFSLKPHESELLLINP